MADTVGTLFGTGGSGDDKYSTSNSSMLFPSIILFNPH